MTSLRRIAAATCLALAATTAAAQAPAPLVVPNAADQETTALPIIRNNQVEGFLLIESGSNQGTRSSLDRILGRQVSSPSVGAGVVFPLEQGRRVSTSLTLESNPTIGLLCNGGAVSRNFGSLSRDCLVANLAPGPAAPLALSQPGVRAEARLQGDSGSLSASLGLNRFEIDGPLMLPGAVDGSGPQLALALNGVDIEQEDIGLLGELKVGDSGWVSIGGTLARARIIPANQLPGGLPPQWNSGTLSVGGGVGNFGGEIIGRVIEIPGGTASYSNVGLGVTWRAPWRARLSVGAENVISRGQNPFAPGSEDGEDEDRVPYIRYEQDL
jgi:hypothetical protein